MAALPPFIRFEKISLDFLEGLQTISVKCKLVLRYLRSVKEALSDAKEINYFCGIDQNDPSQFRNNSALIAYLRDGLLPICDFSREYNFTIMLGSDNNSEATNIIESILKIHQINRCSKIGIDFFFANPTRLPIVAISNWLDACKSDRMGITGKKELFLSICVYHTHLLNIAETRKFLQVYFLSICV